MGAMRLGERREGRDEAGGGIKETRALLILKVVERRGSDRADLSIRAGVDASKTQG